MSKKGGTVKFEVAHTGPRLSFPLPSYPGPVHRLTRCSVGNKEQLSTNIRGEYASDFCYDRKSTLKGLFQKKGANKTNEFSCKSMVNVESFSYFMLTATRLSVV